ncbi:hypothetical protein T281_03420 [Rhodomicrobium udaipurense JA643]|uniref:Anti-sigma factor NepR domain-containing protein n=1 Tax=Rhodomicrobium udaipurense TaxID=1202716 RepID=A0A8I1GGT7_9HYPH|nr:hypothetical protein [Rhodomicrobium udaipurense]KAI95827.1 hypothetical protein T281_03420 [Rhodomicrobium udaipurense JA643]MBJ7543631.1 hypothetical protein [Rhodomicrobium udaipurense]
MMNENDTSEREASAPLPQSPLKDDEAGLVVKLTEMPEDKGAADGAGDSEQKPPLDPTYDEARFAAGVVKLYEKLLAEPIPDDMLALINKIEKQERN